MLLSSSEVSLALVQVARIIQSLKGHSNNERRVIFASIIEAFGFQGEDLKLANLLSYLAFTSHEQVPSLPKVSISATYENEDLSMQEMRDLHFLRLTRCFHFGSPDSDRNINIGVLETEEPAMKALREVANPMNTNCVVVKAEYPDRTMYFRGMVSKVSDGEYVLLKFDQNELDMICHEQSD